MLPNDIARCAPSRGCEPGKGCPFMESCRRYLEPGPLVSDWSLSFLGGTECGAYIPVETPDKR